MMLFPGDMSCLQGAHEVFLQGDMILSSSLKDLDIPLIKRTKSNYLR